MPNIRDRIAANTAKLPSARDIDVSQSVACQDQRSPRTAIGMMAAVAAARDRIRELQRTVASKSLLPTANIEPNPFQTRGVGNDKNLAKLVSPIEESQLAQSILVRSHPAKPGFYQIVAGERRFRIHLLSGRTEIEAEVIEVEDHLMAMMARSEA